MPVPSAVPSTWFTMLALRPQLPTSIFLTLVFTEASATRPFKYVQRQFMAMELSFRAQCASR